GVERPLAEDLAELVGQLDRRDIGVVERAPAHERGERHVAQKAGQTRGDRPAADQEDIAVHCARFSWIRGWAEIRTLTAIRSAPRRYRARGLRRPRFQPTAAAGRADRASSRLRSRR